MNTEKQYWIYTAIELKSTIKALEAFISSMIQVPFGHTIQIIYTGSTDRSAEQPLYKPPHEEITAYIQMSNNQLYCCN